MRSSVTRPREPRTVTPVVVILTTSRPTVTSQPSSPAAKANVPATFEFRGYRLPATMGWLTTADEDVITATLSTLPDKYKIVDPTADAVV